MEQYMRRDANGTIQWHCGACDCWQGTGFLLSGEGHEPRVLCAACLGLALHPESLVEQSRLRLMRVRALLAAAETRRQR